MKKIVFLLLFVCMGVSSALSQELILNGKWKYITGIDNAEFSKKDFNDSGKVFGEEVVQLYVGDDVSSVSRPQKELKGFKKIGLNPGKKQKISFTLMISHFITRICNGFLNQEPLQL